MLMTVYDDGHHLTINIQYFAVDLFSAIQTLLYFSNDYLQREFDWEDAK